MTLAVDHRLDDSEHEATNHNDADDNDWNDNGKNNDGRTFILTAHAVAEYATSVN